MPTAHGRDVGERSPDGVEADNNWGTTDGGMADGQPMETSDITGTRDLGNAVAMNVEGVARVPEGRGRAGVTEDRGDVKEKGELAATIGVKGWRAADSPQVRGESNQGETNQGRAGRTWEPGGATSPRVSGGTECGRSQDGAVRPRWSEEIRGSTS